MGFNPVYGLNFNLWIRSPKGSIFIVLFKTNFTVTINIWNLCLDTAIPVYKESGDITSMSWADGYIEIAENIERVEKGTPVTVKLF